MIAWLAFVFFLAMGLAAGIVARTFHVKQPDRLFVSVGPADDSFPGEVVVHPYAGELRSFRVVANRPSEEGRALEVVDLADEAVAFTIVNLATLIAVASVIAAAGYLPWGPWR